MSKQKERRIVASENEPIETPKSNSERHYKSENQLKMVLCVMSALILIIILAKMSQLEVHEYIKYIESWAKKLLEIGLTLVGGAVIENFRIRKR